MYGKRGYLNPMWGKTHTPEVRARMSAAAKNHMTEAAKRNLSEKAIGRKASAEARHKMSLAHKGKPLSEEHYKKLLANVRRGPANPNFGKKGELSPMFGRKLSEETKGKIRKARAEQVRRPCSEETKRKMSASNRGQKRSKEFCDKMRSINLQREQSGANNPNYGNHLSEEAKARISAANKDKICVIRDNERKMINPDQLMSWEELGWRRLKKIA